MNLSWPHRAAGKARRRGSTRVWVVGVTAAAVAGAMALAAPGAFASAKAPRAKAATTTTMSAASGYVGTKIKLTAKVKGSSPAGTVKFTYAGKALCSAALSKGSAACWHVFGGVGSLHVEALYEGNATHKTSFGLAWVKVIAQPTSVKVTASAGALQGKDVTLTAVVAPTAATGTVTFSDAGGRLGAPVKVSGGKATLKYAWSGAGTYNITAAYSGDATHAKSSGTVKVTVAAVYATTTVITIQVAGDPYSPTLNWETAGTVTVPVTVTDDVVGGPAPTGTVAITDPPDIPDQPANPAFTGCTGANAATLTPAAGVNADGEAYSTGECQVSTPTEAWGFVLMRATYTPGTSTFAGSNTGDTEYKIINQMPTETTVGTADGTDTAAAGTVDLVADVIPLPPIDAANLLDAYSEQVENGPAGDTGDTVSFTIDGAAVAACTDLPLQPPDGADPSNYVDCDVTLAAGPHTVVATFSGDEYATTSTSATVTVTVTG